MSKNLENILIDKNINIHIHLYISENINKIIIQKKRFEEKGVSFSINKIFTEFNITKLKLNKELEEKIKKGILYIDNTFEYILINNSHQIEPLTFEEFQEKESNILIELFEDKSLYYNEKYFNHFFISKGGCYFAITRGLDEIKSSYKYPLICINSNEYDYSDMNNNKILTKTEIPLDNSFSTVIKENKKVSETILLATYYLDCIILKEKPMLTGHFLYNSKKAEKELSLYYRNLFEIK